MALAFEVACDPRVTCYRLRKFTGGEGWGSSIDTQEHGEGSSPFFFDYKGRRIWFCYARVDGEPTYRVLPARPHEPMVKARFHWAGGATIVCHLGNSTLTIDLVDGVSFCPRLDPDPKMIEAVFFTMLRLLFLGREINRRHSGLQRDMRMCTTPANIHAEHTMLVDETNVTASILFAVDSEIAPDAIRLGGRNAIRHLYTGNYDDMVPAHRQAQGDYSRDLERLASLNRSDPLRIRRVVKWVRSEYTRNYGLYFIHLRGLASRLIHNQPSVSWLVSEATGPVCEEVLRAGSTKSSALPVADQIPAILLRQAFHLVPEWRKPDKNRSGDSLCDLEGRARKVLWGDEGDWMIKIEKISCRLLTYLGVPEGTARTISVSDDLCPVLSAVIEASR
jgi:hypothetical protein